MTSLLRTATIAFFAGINDDKSLGLIGHANCARLEQKIHRDMISPGNSNLIQIQQQLDIQNNLIQGSELKLYTENKAKWGFLKNIVNIDRFFASGADEKEAPKKEKESLVQKQSLSKGKATDDGEAQDPDEFSADTGAEDAPTQNVETQIKKSSSKKKSAKKAKKVVKHIQQEDEEEEPPVDSAVVQQKSQNANTEDIKQAEKTLKKKSEKETKKEAKKEKKTAAKVQAKAEKKPIKIATKKKAESQSLAESTEQEQVFTSKAEKAKHDSKVREEGLHIIKVKGANTQEVDLEIEDPGSANSVAEEGAKTLTEEEYKIFDKQLNEARKKPENKLGKGGFLIDLKDPKEFSDQMRVVIMTKPEADEKTIKAEKFDTKDQAQAQTASMAMAMTLQTEVGATIVSDQPGNESIIQNFNSDTAKTTSQISSGYSIRHNFVQKMAPGDNQYHMISWDTKKKYNNMKTFQKRSEAEIGFKSLGEIPKILVSGETGDVLLANGEQNLVDQCLGMFYTQRYQGKYYGRP